MVPTGCLAQDLRERRKQQVGPGKKSLFKLVILIFSKCCTEPWSYRWRNRPRKGKLAPDGIDKLPDCELSLDVLFLVLFPLEEALWADK